MYMFCSRCTFMDNIMFPPFFSICLWGTAMHWFMVPTSWLKHRLSISLLEQLECPAEPLPRITYRRVASDEKKPTRGKRNSVGICLLFKHIRPLLVDCFSMMELSRLTKSHQSMRVKASVFPHLYFLMREASFKEQEFHFAFSYLKMLIQ